MSENAYDESLRRIARLVGERASPEEVLAEAAKLKQRMTNDVHRVWLAVATLDNLVALFAPDEPWQAGWWSETVTATSTKVPSGAQRPPRYRRTERALDIARILNEEGASTVRTEKIATRLLAEGDTGSISDLATAVGNILTRSGNWQRIGPGEYGPMEQEVK